MASISFTCPSCAKVLRSSSPPPAGKKVRCPACGEAFLPDLDAEEEATRIQEKPTAKARVKSKKTDDANPAPPPKKRRRDDDDQDDDYDDRPAKKKKAKPKSSRSMLVVLLGLGAGVALLSCIGCGVGVFIWPGFTKSANIDMAAFVAPDANVVMGGNPKLMRSKTANLKNLLGQQGPLAQFNQAQMEDVSLNSERMLAFSHTSNFEQRLVTIFQSTASDIAKIKSNHGLGAAQTVGGHANVHKQGPLAKQKGLPQFIAFPGGDIVVTAEQSEQELIAALDRAKQGAQPNAALTLGRAVERSPFWLAVVPDANALNQLRQGIEQGGPMAPQALRNAGPAFAGIKGVTVAVDFTDAQDIQVNANIQCRNPDDAAKIKAGIDDGWGLVKAGLQLQAAMQAFGQPQMPPTLMADLNSVAFGTQGTTVTGAMKISAQTMQDMAKLGAGQMFPGAGPGPINPPKKIGPKNLPGFDGMPKIGPAKDSLKKPPTPGPAKTTAITLVNILPGQFQERSFPLQKGKSVTVTMKSTVTDPMTDVDLYVYQGDAGEQIIAVDSSIGPDGIVTFVVPMTGNYRVRVRNLGPGTATSSLINVTEQ